MYTIEQLEVLMLIAEDWDDPVATAKQIRRRWAYILQTAVAASQGRLVDMSLPQVVRDHTTYARKSQLILAAIDEWLEERQRQQAG